MLDRVPQVLPLLLPWLLAALAAVVVLPPLVFGMVYAFFRLILPGRQLELMVGSRYLRARKFPRLLSAVTYISVSGMMLGVMALIIVIGVMSGFEDDLKSKILGTNSHVVVLNSANNTIYSWPEILAKVAAVDQVASASPFIYSQVMVASESGVLGAVLRGIDPAREASVTDLARNLRSGSLDKLESGDGWPGVILGREMANQLGVEPGDEVRVISPFGETTPAGPAPRIVSFRVVGVFKSGMFEYDSGLVYISLSQAQRFLSLGDGITGIEVKVEDIYGARRVAEAIRERLGFPYSSRDWMEMNQAFFTALKLERIAMFVILTLIVFVASFSIISSLIMKVLEKHRDIAVLKSVGATRRQIMGIFISQGVVIGIVGTLLGDLFGLGVLQALDKYKFITLPSNVYYIDTLPVKMDPAMVILISVAAVIISFAATFYPSWKASGVDPVVALRYE